MERHGIATGEHVIPNARVFAENAMSASESAMLPTNPATDLPILLCLKIAE